MPRPRGYNELDLPRDGSAPTPPEHPPSTRAAGAHAPPPVDARGLWETIASHVLALDAFQALRSCPESPWTEHTDLEGGTRHEHTRLAVGGVSVDLTFASRVSDTHAGPIEVDRDESLVGRVDEQLVVHITRRPPAPPVVMIGPAHLDAAIRRALAAQVEAVTGARRPPRRRRRGSRGE